jgi:shikimate dehydrogenase
MKRFGIIGNPLEHSFSSEYFLRKFKDENIKDAIYENFLLDSIDQLPALLDRFTDIRGLNVTIPFKEQVIQYLHETDREAKEIGAVNTIRVTQGLLKGYNTDAPAFEQTIAPLKSRVSKALVLGTGGASKAICYVLGKLAIGYLLCSRLPYPDQLTYDMLNEQIISKHNLIINATPVGMYPDINLSPAIPYQYLTSDNILYDLVYNPEETEFLKRGKAMGAETINGSEMLKLQAELAWKIWSPISQ